jgi:hypothetical protein
MQFFCILFAWFFFSVEIRPLIVKVSMKEGVGVAPHGEPDLTLAKGTSDSVIRTGNCPIFFE